MDKKITYHEQTSRENTLKLRSVLQTLPDFTKDFFRAIEPEILPERRRRLQEQRRLFPSDKVRRQEEVPVGRRLRHLLYRRAHLPCSFAGRLPVTGRLPHRGILYPDGWIIQRFCDWAAHLSAAIRRFFFPL